MTVDEREAVGGALADIDAIADPAERALQLNGFIKLYTERIKLAREMRRAAIADLLRSGMGVADVSRTVYMSQSTVKLVQQAMDDDSI